MASDGIISPTVSIRPLARRMDRLYHSPLARNILLVLLGLCAGGIVIAAFATKPLYGLAAAAAFLALPLLAYRPLDLFWLFLLAILVLEEFPSGYGETAERSLRTPFYGTSIGIPGTYATDLLLYGVLALYLLDMLLRRRSLRIPLDGIGMGLMAMVLTAITSVVFSFLDGDPLRQGLIQETAGTGFEVNEIAARLIAFFQFKNFSCLFSAYLLGIIVIQTPAHVRKFVKTVGIGIVICVGIGIFRLVTHPEWVAQTIPLFYDSPSVWLFGMVGFYVVAAWSLDLLDHRRTVMLAALTGVLAVFILLSFRRTMWGGILFCMVPFFFWISGRARVRLFVAGLLGACLVGVALLASPVGSLIMKSVFERVGQTSVADTSTLYRLALAVYVTQHYSEIPLFGYGVMPLWNKFMSLGYFRTNIENAHSLYYWLLFRMGMVGLATALLTFGIAVRKAWVLSRNAINPHDRVMAIVLMLAIVLFLFSGIFNPVYAETRYTITLGLGLALISRIGQFNRMTEKSEAIHGSNNA